jgi:hypothetical protein
MTGPDMLAQVPQITRFGFPASPLFLSGMAQPARVCCIAHRAAAEPLVVRHLRGGQNHV